jgi:hypothetical protein
MFDLTNLRPATQIDVVKIVNDPHAEAAWRIEEPRLRALAIPDGTGGVNPGDRRAIFYLVHHLRARRVLEIGTHVGFFVRVRGVSSTCRARAAAYAQRLHVQQLR